MTNPKWFVYDIEADNLLDGITKVHCAVVYDLFSEESWEFTPETIHKLPQKLAEADALWGHNIISYDNPAVKKIYPDEYLDYMSQFDGKEGVRVFDSMVLARLVWPDIKSMDWENVKKGALVLPNEPGALMKLVGSHSLRAWGYRLGFFKGNADGEVDFATYTPEMLQYCKRDVLLNVKLIRLILAKLPEWVKFDSEGNPTEFNEVSEHVYVEHQFYRYLEYQMGFGVCFDKELALTLCKHWNTELDKRTHEMRQLVPDIVEESQFTPKVTRPDLGYEKGVTITKRKVVKFNPRSTPHVVNFLVNKYGWEPQEYTKPTKSHPSGQPQANYDILKNLPYKEAPLLARIKLLMERLKLVQDSKGGGAWLQCVKETANGDRIFGRIIHNGTPTARCRHMSPNLGNIPSTKAIWGSTIRKLFKATTGYSLVGVDFDGLEMRCLSEVLWDFDNGKFFEMAFSGDKSLGTDAHSLNREAVRKFLLKAGIDDIAEVFKGKSGREISKTAFYAWLYGAYPKKLGSIACEGLPVSEAKIKKVGACIKEGFFSNMSGLEKLVGTLEKEYQACLARGEWPHIKMPSGYKVPIRKKSALLNSLLQTLGAILCKKACVLLLEKMENGEYGVPGKYWKPVLHVHDEIQVEVLDDTDGEIIEQFISDVVECFGQAGRAYGFRVPIVGSAATGPNWSATH